MAALALAVAIVDVRESIGRSRVSAELKALVPELRPMAPSGLFQVAWGDEMQAVLPSRVDLWDFYIRTRKSLRELPFYMGVGFGELSDPVMPLIEGSVHDLNGSAFKSARNAVERAKRDAFQSVALAFDVYENRHLTTALNAYVRMINDAYRQMTPKQRTYFNDVLLGDRHDAIAVRHGVSQPTISTTLKRAGAGQLDSMREGLSALLTFVGDYLGWGAAMEEGTS